MAHFSHDTQADRINSSKLTQSKAQPTSVIVPLKPTSSEASGYSRALAKALAFDREARTRTVETVLAGLAADTRPRARPAALLGAAILIAIAAVGLTFFALEKLWLPRQTQVIVSNEGAVVPDTISQKSIAVS